MIYMSFFIGLILICKGGDWFVDAASKISETLGIPKYVVGATIVSFATTMPEIIVSAAAALKGHSAMAIGNAVGSVSANTGIILAISLFFLPAAIKRQDYIIKTILYIGTLVLLLISFKDRVFDWSDCILLLLAGILFLIMNIKNAFQERNRGFQRKNQKNDSKIQNKECWKMLGAVAIVAGSEILVKSACEIAEKLHISEEIISVTIVAMGTSLPEFVTTVTAIIKKESSLSVGNIVGANMIDSAFILPVCTLLGGKSLPVSTQMALIDMPVCILVSVVALFPMLYRNKIARIDGVFTLLIYSSYLIYICRGNL